MQSRWAVSNDDGRYAALLAFDASCFGHAYPELVRAYWRQVDQLRFWVELGDLPEAARVMPDIRAVVAELLTAD
jgi:hypothetical protein